MVTISPAAKSARFCKPQAVKSMTLSDVITEKLKLMRKLPKITKPASGEWGLVRAITDQKPAYLNI